MTQVIKFGGSLVDPPVIDAALQWVMRVALAGPTVIVPGGGAYADTVRDLQTRFCLDDACAHRQALLAMAQTAHLIQSRVRNQWQQHWPISQAVEAPIVVWSPEDWVWREDLPMRWALSSDSLALILAETLGAGRCLLMKSLPKSVENRCWEEWVAASWVDALFPHYAAHFQGKIRLVGREEWLGEP